MYQPQRVKGDILKLSFLNSEFKKQQRIKVKNLLVLELLSLQKACFYFELNKNKRKKVFIPQESHIMVTKKLYNYFLYNFSKNSIGLIKNLPLFFNELTPKKQQININEFSSLINNNSVYFNDLISKISLIIKTTSPQEQFLQNKRDKVVATLQKQNILQQLSFYKIKL